MNMYISLSWAAYGTSSGNPLTFSLKGMSWHTCTHDGNETGDSMSHYFYAALSWFDYKSTHQV